MITKIKIKYSRIDGLVNNAVNQGNSNIRKTPFEELSLKQAEKNQKKNITVKEGCILLFCWDTDSFRQINVKAVTSIQPLGTILRNRIP